MADQALNFFLASGPGAERTAFTPNPATPSVGPDPSYIWLETDSGDLYGWDFGGAAWVGPIGSLAGGLLAANNLSDLANPATAAQNLSLEPGVDVQAYSANLDEFAAVNPTSAGLALLDDATASDQLTTLGVSAFAKTILDDADAAAVRTTIGAAAAGAGLSDGDKGDITVSSSGAVWTIDNEAVTYAKMQDVSAAARVLGRASGAGSGDVTELTAAQLATILGTNVKSTESLGFAVSDETTALTTGTAKLTFRMPYAFTLSAVRASVTTAPTGSTLIVDINEGGSTILSTKLSIDASEKTSTTAASAAVISDTALADDAEITIDIDQIGSTIAGAGLKIWLIGTRT